MLSAQVVTQHHIHLVVAQRPAHSAHRFRVIAARTQPSLWRRQALPRGVLKVEGLGILAPGGMHIQVLWNTRKHPLFVFAPGL